jgi:response regulator RpfG family c-di-GMP phosphodiesterase
MSEKTKEKEAKGEKLSAHIIDSDPVSIKMLTLILEGMGLKVTSHEYTPEIYKEVENMSPDFLIIELKVPGKKSGEILEGFCKDRRFTRIKIVICSSIVGSSECNTLLRRYKLDRAYSKPLDGEKFIREFKKMIDIRIKQKNWKTSYE